MSDETMQQCNRLIELSQDINGFIDLFRQLWIIPQSYDVFCEMEKAVDYALEYHGGHLELRIYKAALPSKRQEWSETAYRCLSLAREHPDVYWCYANGLTSAQAGAHYDIAHEMVDLLEDHYEAWPPEIICTLLIAITQIGTHRVAAPMWNFLLREHPTAVSPWLHKRFAWFFHNLETMPRVRLISLGENCWPWTKLAEWGLRPDAHHDIEQLPLNCGIQSTAGCAPILEAGFSDMGNPEFMRTIPDATGIPLPYSKKYRFIFNHEAGTIWSTNNFEKLQNRYSSRIDNFNEIATKGKRVYVYYIHRTVNIGNIESIIRSISHDNNYKLVIVDVRSNIDEWIPSDENTIYFRRNLPWPGFHWVERGSCDGELGVAFEKDIMDVVSSAMKLVSEYQ